MDGGKIRGTLLLGNINFSFYILFSNKSKLVILVLPFKRKMGFSMSSLSEYEAMSCPVTPISGCMRPGRAGVSYDFCDRAFPRLFGSSLSLSLLLAARS